MSVLKCALNIIIIAFAIFALDDAVWSQSTERTNTVSLFRPAMIELE